MHNKDFPQKIYNVESSKNSYNNNIHNDEDYISNKYADNKQRFPIYDSPSRLSVVTPIRNALRNSNNNVSVFLDKLQQLNKFKSGIQKLSIEKKKGEGEENELPNML